MQEIARIIAASEDWLMERVLSCALARGYAKYASTLKEAWRLSINGLSEARRRMDQERLLPGIFCRLVSAIGAEVASP
jgi:diguanylate cyclase